MRTNKRKKFCPEWLLEETVEKVNSRDFNSLKFIETDVSG
jgi:hypothetical protein